MTDSTPTVETKSTRLVNYTKAIATGVVALSGLVALVLSLYTTFRKPEEKAARSGYAATTDVVDRLGRDVQAAFKDSQDLAKRLLVLETKVDILLMMRGKAVPLRPPPVVRPAPPLRQMPSAAKALRAD